MKKLLIVISLAVFFVSCIYEDCICNEENPDSIGGNLIFSDSDLADLPENEDLTDNDPDNQTTDENVTAPDSDNTSAQECGNGVIETGETCDKNSVQCKELDTDFESGMAICKTSCTGWDTSNCIAKPEETTPLAVIPAKSFTVDYLYSGVNDFSNGANQANELYNQPLFSASIPLTNGTYYIPHNLADAHWLAGFFDSQSIQFVQQSYVQSSGEFTTPYIVMGASLSDAKKDAVLSVGISNVNEVNFIVSDVLNDQDCIILVGYGTLTVNSINTTAGNPGEFSFTTSKIELYLPSKTPEGDVTSDIESSGFIVCQ